MREKSNKKLYSFDLDGTILNSKKEISTNDLKELKKICERDYILLNSGRSFFRLEKFIKIIGVLKNHRIACCNFGSYIYDFKNDVIIYENYFTKKILTFILNYFKEEKDCIVSLETSKETLTNIINTNYSQARIEELKLRKVNLTEAIQTEKILKVCIINEKNKLDEFLIKFKEYAPKYNYVKRYDNYLEIYGTETKGSGLKKVSDVLGISIKNIISFGNDDTDISLREFTEILIAPANSCDNIIKYSDYLTSDNDNNPLFNFKKECK